VATFHVTIYNYLGFSVACWR